MALVLEPEVKEKVPLRATADGVVLVGGTRVPLDAVVSAFNAGQSAEEIALGYPTLALADVYAVLAYYLRHRGEIDAYVLTRRREANALRTRIEAETDPRGIRERLLVRRLAKETQR